ncbi:hypothetical protein PSU4_19020 [Pseudonocardia sulfidoxydans NBRC 16205]|uniref:Uncharacterized protein n=1 Tax=Pseudonocardia sulfidoxydans NBRC 16205 TaxID=1223511 RepID=A0A511DIV2_9PSEU|nr:hypothetical protein PSU4_19020 [Pseudonocardia sulfidoxydans NBRC 16205]
MLVDVLAVPGDGPLAALVLVEVAVEQLVDRGRCVRTSSLLDLGHEAEPNLLGPVPYLRARRYYLDEVVPAFRDRVDAPVDAESTARQLVDASLLTLPRIDRPGHDARSYVVRVTLRVTSAGSL